MTLITDPRLDVPLKVTSKQFHQYYMARLLSEVEGYKQTIPS